MQNTILFILAILSVQVMLAQDVSLRQTVKGTIIDEQSGNALANVNVSIDGINSSGDITDSIGNFKLRNVPIGRQTVLVSLVGYEEAIIRNVEVTSSKEVVLEIKLKERIKKLDEITVKSYKQKNRA